MVGILLPDGDYLSIPFGDFRVCPEGNTVIGMQTIAETRRARLEMLIEKHGGKIANLNEALGFARNDTRLARIRNANVRHERGATKTYVMGEEVARQIEDLLQLERGWMDTPPTYAELHKGDDPRVRMMQLLESLPQDQWPVAARLLDALAERPAPANGTTGQ